ncbi:nitroreductase family protein [Pseudoalteromonas prydzensis]|uniref:Nitroreductase family protein n=1 Tax=Pseudoalteromonas prydzensis TaxID=182141 RepID=A0ABR9FRQ8_9GAMM|nr:nitroreductase family protein [Pseudoalteromonas prydzensis]MBE0459499.1 nitroreductase family protein [Pseudoalteromonas prydzensis]
MKTFLKRIAPITLLIKIKKLVDKVDQLAILIFAKTKMTSSLYYFLFNSSFMREHQSVLKGRIKYYESLESIEDSCVLLRRNIHRLEKGLIMRPRRDVFGNAFIGETVSSFILAIEQDAVKESERTWFIDVLSEYFEVVSSSPEIDAAREEFYRVCSGSKISNQSKSIPYSHKSIPKADISFEQLEMLFKQRRSVRWYEDRDVDVNLIRKAVNIATQAPSACNRQPFKFHTVTNKGLVKKVADCAMGTVGFSHNLKTIIAVVGELSSYPAERDRHVIYIDGALVTMQLMLALETLGLSTCAINWPDIESREKMLDELLGLKKYERTIMLLAVGYADPEGGIPYSQKKDCTDLIKVVK